MYSQPLSQSQSEPNYATNLTRLSSPTRLKASYQDDVNLNSNQNPVKVGSYYDAQGRMHITSRQEESPKQKQRKLPEQMDLPKKDLNNVIVLADNKNYNRQYLSSLGMSVGSPYLCTLHIPTRLFTFQIYGLEETDEKIFNHANNNAGLIIITTLSNYPKLYERINFYAEKINTIPILIVMEYNADIMNLTSGQISQIEKEKHIQRINASNVKYFYTNTNIKYSSVPKYERNDEESWFVSKVLDFKPKPINIIPLEQLVREFVDCKLSIADWNHFNRLRLVYFSLKNFGYDKTIDQNGWMCVNWNKYKNTIGHSHLWNYTLTKFWIDQVFSLMLKEPKADFAHIYSENEHLSNGSLHKKYYTNELLFSAKARSEWIEPDLI